MREKFEEAIIRFLNNRLDQSVNEDDIDWTGNMFDSGYLDSLGIYQLLLYLEQEFSISLPLSDLLENFPSSLNELFIRLLNK